MSVDLRMENHAAELLFSISFLDHSAEKTLLAFSASHNLTDYRASGSFLGCLVDYTVRLAARQSIGNYLVSEYEINFQPDCRAREFIACAQIMAADQQHAAYTCEVHIMENGEKKLFAEAQGTLVPR